MTLLAIALWLIVAWRGFATLAYIAALASGQKKNSAREAVIAVLIDALTLAIVGIAAVAVVT